MAEIWDMVPVSSVGTYVAQFGNSAMGEAECQIYVSKSPLSWLCDLHSLFCWELLEWEPEPLQWAAEGLQDLAGTCTSHLLSPHSAPVAVTLLSFSWTGPAPTSGPFRFHVPFTSQALSSLSPSNVSTKCQITFSRGLPGPSCSEDSSCFPRAPLLRPRFSLLYKLAAGAHTFMLSPLRRLWALCKQGFHLFSSELCFGE